jgi:hypothetical protein
MKRFLVVVFALAGCSSPSLQNGTQKCSSTANCPDGYHCATDGTCWKNGQDPPPPDMATPPSDGSVSTAHTGSAVLSGGVTASSEHYKIITSTGQAPGGNANAASANVKNAAGVAGATQQTK